MEVRLEASENHSSVQDTFVSLRVGDVQKQSRFGASRTYRFPDPGEGRRGFGRIEVFKRVGHATISFDEEDDVLQDVKVPCQLPDCDTLNMKIGVNAGGSPMSPSGEKFGNKMEKTARAKARMDVASRYLAEHRIEEMLAEAMREVICEKPQDPHRFLADLILRQAPAPAKPPVPIGPQYAVCQEQAAQKSRPLEGAAMAGPEQHPLEPALMLPFTQKPSVGTWLHGLPVGLPEEKPPPRTGPWNVRPSVGTWLRLALPEDKERMECSAELEPQSPMSAERLRKMKAEEIAAAFQDEISKKDAEIAALKRLLGL